MRRWFSLVLQVSSFFVFLLEAITKTGFEGRYFRNKQIFRVILKIWVAQLLNKNGIQYF